MALDPRRAGSASALIGSAHFGIGSVCAAVASALLDGTARPFAAVIVVTSFVAVLVLKILVPHKLPHLQPLRR
jgi:DHA1 family bicyclomycin/chloramphenicol resistance-like MFS transporter